MSSRRVAGRVLIVVASVLAFIAILAIWVNRQLLNTDNWTTTSTTLLERPVIRDQVAGFLVDQLYANVDVAGELSAALPPRLQPLAGPAASGLRELANRAAVEALQRPRVQELWANASRASQQQFIKLLDGGGPALSNTNGEVVLHLDTLLKDLSQRVGVGGRLAAALPAGAADIVLLRSDQLAAAQKVLKVLRVLPYVALIGAFALFGIALLVAPDWRRKALRAFGIGITVAGLLALLVRSEAGTALSNELAHTAAVRPAILQGWTISTTLLEQAAVATIAYGVSMIVLAWLVGPTQPAVALRRFIAPYAREPLFAYAGLAVIVALLLWWAPTPALRNPALSLVLIALLAIFTEVFRRQIGREYPDAERSGTMMATARDHARRAGQWMGGQASSGRAVVMEHVPGSGADPAQARIDSLERLARLHDTGVLSDEEFATQKTQVLEGEASPASNGPKAPLAPNP
jgi:hypothetical protein